MLARPFCFANLSSGFPVNIASLSCQLSLKALAKQYLLAMVWCILTQDIPSLSRQCVTKVQCVSVCVNTSERDPRSYEVT